MVAGAKLAWSYQNTPTFKKYQLQPIVDKVFCGDLTVGSDKYLQCVIQHHITTVWHFAGSCKMGSDPMAVVDNRLKVHGVNRLRVVDASIMPTLVGGNTNAPAIMIGEKGASLILSDWAQGKHQEESNKRAKVEL